MYMIRQMKGKARKIVRQINLHYNGYCHLYKSDIQKGEYMADKDYGTSTVEELKEILKQYQEENSDKEE